MDNSLISNQVIVQIGLVVHDVEATSQAYADIFGVEKPKWFLTDPVEKTQCTYQGEPTEARAKLAFLNFGQVQVELIEPDGHPSTWREHLDAHGEGVHHIAFMVENMGERVKLFEQRGISLVQKGEYTGGRYAYLDTSNELKVILELLERDKK